MPQSGGEQLIQLGINSILTSPIGTPGHDQIFGTNTPTVTGVPLLNSLNGDKNHNIVNIPTRPSDAFISNNTLGAVAVSEGNAGEIDSIPNFPFENNILNILKYWITVVRAPFLTATIAPIMLGSAIAYNQFEVFDWSIFWMVLFGAVCAQIGTNNINDYFDHKSGTDKLKEGNR